MNNQYSFYSNCGCLYSESSVALKKFSDSSHELQPNIHSYSQTCLQNVSNADSLKQIFLSKESIHIVKLNTLRKRMLVSLTGIQGLLGDSPQPDGVDDLKRRQQRAAEFSSRFCRNYLYPLQRQMNIILKMWRNLSLNHTHSAYFTLCQKVIATHQNAHLALQAYFHHMPCSVEKGVPEKLEELLLVVNNLCCICSKLDMSEDSEFNSKKVKQQCQKLMLQMRTEVTDDEKESYIAPSQSCTQKNVAHNQKKESVSHRFSMYSGNTPCKSSSSLNKKAARMSVTNKKKPVKTQSKKQALKELKVPSDSKVKNIIYNPVTEITRRKNVEEDNEIGGVCANDDIKTMMDFLVSEEIPVKYDLTSKKLTKKATCSFLEEINKQPTTSPSSSTLRKLETEIKNLKKQTRCLKDMGHPNYPMYVQALEAMSLQLTGIKTRIQSSKSYSQANETKKSVIQRKKEDSNIKLKTEFPKNVKLICVSSVADKESLDDNPVLENNVMGLSQQNNYCKPVCHKRGSEKKKEIHTYEYESNSSWEPLNVDKCHSSDKNKIVSFLPECITNSEEYSCDVSIRPATDTGISGFTENLYTFTEDESRVIKLIISHHEISSIMAYRQNFQEYAKSIFLYKDTIRPWLMVARLANNLLDNVLEEIVFKDTGIQKISSRLLQLEFQ